MESRDICLSPIGEVRLRAEGFVLEIDPKFRDGLTGLEGFSHLNILWWSHQLDQPELRSTVILDQPYRKGPAKLGVFATRSPLRPNLICTTVVPVIDLNINSGKITIAYIDAEEGTPILDIKPYYGNSDRVKAYQVPGWCKDWPDWYEDSATFAWDEILSPYPTE